MTKKNYLDSFLEKHNGPIDPSPHYVVPVAPPQDPSAPVKKARKVKTISAPADIDKRIVQLDQVLMQLNVGRIYDADKWVMGLELLEMLTDHLVSQGKRLDSFDQIKEELKRRL